MRRITLTRSEQAIENALVRGEYADVSRAKLRTVAQAVTRRRKNAVISRVAV